MYRKFIDPITGSERTNAILRIADNTFIPFAEDNRDYQEYLAWVAAGNQPLPAEEQS